MLIRVIYEEEKVANSGTEREENSGGLFAIFKRIIYKETKIRSHRSRIQKPNRKEF
jgi:hypothetical protein